ncbi:MAG: hypothetical protein IJX26_01890, partial [Clostridia bacterium]|nr:hypothetical protein [Clostridia bacterium]
MLNSKLRKILMTAVIVLTVVLSAVIGVMLINTNDNRNFVESGWDGVTAIKPEGSGISGDPYLIETPENLYWISNNIEDYEHDSHYVLLNDIDLNNKDWKPIGTNNNPFSGIFDGKGFSIINIGSNEKGYYSSGAKQAPSLFGVASYANIEGLNVEYAYNKAVGTIGYGGIVNKATNAVTINKCSNRTHGITFEGDVTIANYGGLVGTAYQGTKITNSYSVTNLTFIGKGNAVGGLVGGCKFGNNKISNCYTTGRISTDDESTIHYG